MVTSEVPMIPELIYNFNQGDKLVLKDVTDNNLMSSVNPNFKIDSGDQEVLYYDCYLSVGYRAIHRFIKRGEDAGLVEEFTIRDEGIEGVIEGVVILRDGFGYGNSLYDSEDFRSEEKLSGMLKLLEEGGLN